MNRELFQKIHEVIKITPQGFNMHSWETPSEASECGTSRCIAGWAIHLTTGKALKSPDGQLSQSVRELADSLGVEADFEQIGAALLDLDPDDAAALFYASNGDGTKFVRLAAEEGEDAAYAYLEEEIA